MLLVDPPEGWKYGFPREFDFKPSHPNLPGEEYEEELRQWFIDTEYNTLDFGEQMTYFELLHYEFQGSLSNLNKEKLTVLCEHLRRTVKELREWKGKYEPFINCLVALIEEPEISEE